MKARIRIAAGLLSVSCAAPSLAAVDAPAPADVVFTDAHIVTLDAARAQASALAVRDGRVVALGNARDLRPYVGARTRRVALRGATVLPGLTDAHVHVEGLGQARAALDLVGARSLAEALQRAAAAARSLPPGAWLLGRGWDQNDWPDKRFPSAAELDRAVGDRPAYLERVDGHAAWVNTRALRAAGLDARSVDPPGGRVLRDAAGAPTGVLIDAAGELVARHIPAPSRAQRKQYLVQGLQACAAAGLTEVHDAGVDLETVALYKELLAEGQLAVRVYVMLRGPEEFLALPDTLQPEVGLGDGRLTVRAIKAVADGALGSRGALLLEPYSDEPGTRGLATVDWERFDALLVAAHKRGFQVNTHAIGDAANRRVLEAYERVLGTSAGAAARWRIEHAQVLAPSDVPRFKALGVVPSVQPTHCTSDMYWAPARLGPTRVKGAYLWRTFLEQGVPVAGGSDAPVERIDVLPGLYAARTRQDAKGWPRGGFEPRERLTSEQALALFTQHAAFAAFEEHERGRLAPGWRADLTVLDRDITSRPPAALLKTRVLRTVVGGETVYVRP
jgi:hypothetical protein